MEFPDWVQVKEKHHEQLTICLKGKVSKVLVCFLDIHKRFDTVWIDGLFRKLYTGIKAKMWLTITDLYTDKKAFNSCMQDSYPRNLVSLGEQGKAELLLLSC